MTKRRARIMLVEDSEADQVIVQRALEDGRIACDLHIASHGEQALQILRGESPYENELDRLPDLIMMDINMPVMDGKEALQEIRQDEKLRHIPVIMLTTSSRDKDVLESYQLGVNAYLTKPVEDATFVEVVRQLENFWFELVVLPTQ